MSELNHLAAEAWVNRINRNNVQVVKMNISILEYFRIEMDFQNESQEYRLVKEKEFINKLTESLNNGPAIKEIVWVE